MGCGSSVDAPSAAEAPFATPQKQRQASQQKPETPPAGQKPADPVQAIADLRPPFEKAPPSPPAVTLCAKAWAVGVLEEGQDWPEDGLPAIKSRPPTAVSFSGGGSRAFTCALAQMAALEEMGLMANVKHAFGVSGGGWAVMVMSYAALGDDGGSLHVLGDGKAGSPEELSLSKLETTVPDKAAAPYVIVDAHIAKRSIDLFMHRPEGSVGLEEQASPPACWRQAVDEIIFAPCGLHMDALYLWDEAQREDLLGRNPALQPIPVHTVRPDRPFPIVAVALIGPASLVPHLPLETRSYALLEATPLYFGVAARQPECTYVSDAKAAAAQAGGGAAVADRVEAGRREARLHVGGFVECCAMGSPFAPRTPLAAGQRSGEVTVPSNGEMPFSLADAAAAGSWVPGGGMATMVPVPGTADPSPLGLTIPYWSPSDPSGTVTEMLLADGGYISNHALISALQRRDTRVVVFVNSEEPITSRERWNPYLSAPELDKDIAADVGAYFGLHRAHSGSHFQRNQVFREEDFPWVVAAMQDKAEDGTGVVVTTSLETVANGWWAIPAGFRVEVTWVCLGRATAWFDRLPADVRKTLQDDAVTRKFPHYSTMDFMLSVMQARGGFAPRLSPTLQLGGATWDVALTRAHRQVNALREHCKWVLHTHEAVLRSALRGAPLATVKGEPGSEHVVFPPSAAEADARRALVPTVPDKKAFTFSMDARVDNAAGAREKTRELVDGGGMTAMWLQALTTADVQRAEELAAAAALAAKKQRKAAAMAAKRALQAQAC